MATLLKRLSFVARVATQRTPCQRSSRQLCPLLQARFLNTNAVHCRQNVPDDGESVDGFPAASGRGVSDDMEDADDFKNLSLEEIFSSDKVGEDIMDEMEGGALEDFEGEEDALAAEFDKIHTEGPNMDPFENEEDALGFEEDEEEPNWPPGFFSMDEEREDPGEDPEFENDDITSTAHGELEQHRELREFARVMVWDMPLLFNQARAFEAPTAAQPIRFRYTTYMGETHPASRKVVMTFSPSALPDLTEVQSSKLIKLLGVRYNPSTTSAKLSCELYPTAAQNKRYLCDLLDKLTAEAKDPTDTFEDVPFDFRHHKPKVLHVFPEEWKLTEERRKALEARREEKRKLEDQKSLQGNLVQGTLLIEETLRSGVKSEKEAVLQMATGIGQKSKQQKRRATKI